jgi:hypothetical protein
MATTPLKYLNQYFTTTLNVGGGLDNSQTTGIVIQAVSGLDIAKPGVACLTYSDPINTSTAEWITYTSIDGSNELQGVVRGAEGFGAKTHTNGAVVAFPLSESHINNLNAMFDSTGLDVKQIATPANPDSGRNKLYFKSDDKLYGLTSGGTEVALATENLVSSDGWIASTDTFVYVSASTFKITGADRTAIYTPGTRLKLTQTTVKYAVVVSSSFSTDTTVTIAVNTDYTLASAAITLPYYSYQANPQGYPGWFTFTPSETWSNPPSSRTTYARYSVIGRQLTMLFGTNGTANGSNSSASIQITAPISVANFTITRHPMIGSAMWTDNATFTEFGSLYATSASIIFADFPTSTRKPTIVNISATWQI